MAALTLIDTSLIIDVQRGYAPAVQWFTEHMDIAAPRIVWMELIEGFLGKQELTSGLRLIDKVMPIEITVSDWLWATSQLAKYRLSLGVDSFDCLIAAPAFRLQTPLYTRNLKHFRPMLGALAIEPY